MDLLPIICLSFLLSQVGVLGTTFTFINRCDHTVWPGILANAGSPSLDSTGFELPSDASRSFVAPTGWAGRFWGRTGCNFDGSGEGSCKTGDCGSGQVECNGAGAAPPTTLSEFSIATGGQDFYDVSLVDGYNLPLLVEGNGGTGMCAPTGCVADLNRICPMELKVDGACKSACDAFAKPEYCCSGEFNSPATCKPSVYSQMFKNLCPRSYSYAYDDPTSTFTCSGADYTLTFCPSMPSSKASKDPTPTPAAGSNNDEGSIPESGDGNGYSGTGALVTSSGSDPDAESGSGSGTGSGSGAMLADGSYLAGLAMGGATRVPGLNPVALFSVACVFLLFRL